MRRLLAIMTLVMFAFSGSLFAQVFTDFEAGTDGGWATTDWGNNAISTVEVIADPTDASAYVMAINFDANVGEKGVVFWGYNADPGEGDYIMFDLWVPADFPADAAIDLWAQDNVAWSWGAVDTYSGAALVKGGWNTLTFNLKFWSMNAAVTFDPYAPNAIGSFGIQIQDWNAASTFAGQFLLDNITFSDMQVLSDFEAGAGSFAVVDWGDNASTGSAIIADPVGVNGSVFAAGFDAALGFKVAIENCCNINVPETAYLIQYDVYIPSGFLDAATIDCWAQDNVSWSWGPDETYSGATLPRDTWVSLNFNLADWAADEGVSFDPYPPNAIGKLGFQIQDWDATSTFAGQILFDNIRFITMPVVDTWVVADFENPAAGTQGFTTVAWGPAITELAQISDPTGASSGVMEGMLDFNVNVKGTIENGSIILQWDSTGGVVDTGAYAMSIDVFLPTDFPYEGASVSLAYQDHAGWTWTEITYPVVAADSAAGDSAIYVGSWSTITYDFIPYVLDGSVNPYAAGSAFVQILAAGDAAFDYSAAVYYDNLTLYGTAQPEGEVASPPVVASVDTLETVNGMVYNQGHIAWVDNAVGTEVYNIYASTAPITDVTASGVMRIGTGLPHGTEYWNHRPWTTDGATVTYYYAVTAKGSDGIETPLTGECVTGALELVSSTTPKIMYVEDFASSFVLDGLDDEFFPYAEYGVLPEGASGDDSEGWTPASLDMNFSTKFVIDDDYLYISASVTDDDLREAPYQAWEGDALELFIGFYDVRPLSAYHTKGSVDAGDGDWRIGFITDGSTQQSGSADFDFPGLESTAYQNFTGDGYIIEARAALDSLAGTDIHVSNGMLLPFKIDANDQDPSFGDEARSMQVQFAGIDNAESWLRPSAWGLLEVINGPVSVDHAYVPRESKLYNNYPNPFNPTTTLKYDLGTATDVKFTIYNVLGEEVRTLVNGSQAAGTYQLNWDGLNNSGHSVASGLYLYRITTKDFTATNKMMLIR